MTERAYQISEEVKSTAEIRSHFPALERVHEGQRVAYFDGPGGTQVPRPVVEAMVDYLYHRNANTHWAYPTSAETDEAIDVARAAMADLLGGSREEIIFGANMTTIAFHLSRTLGRRLQAGDRIVVTELDHHANVAPWRALERERGVTLKVARMRPETGELDWEDFARQIDSRTKLVAIGAASNALGTINDIEHATRLAHDAGALVFIDGVHFVPHQLPDVRATGCDFLGCSAYKFYGPHVGAMYCRRELLESLDFPKLEPAPETAPERAETGTQNHEGIVGAAAAVDFLASLSNKGTRRDALRATYDALHARGARLVARLWEELSRIEGVTLYGPPPDRKRTPTVSFTVRGATSTEVARHLARRAVFVSHGDFYAATVIERLGLDAEGLVRAGCACYTTEEEVDRLIEGVAEAASRR